MYIYIYIIIFIANYSQLSLNQSRRDHQNVSEILSLCKLLRCKLFLHVFT